ncbi:TPA: hypothetical protein DEQ95_03905 [Candidatus Beckwithbacteria bacterium]|nr:MAG: ribose-phosphate pyrophosphokinase [Candidatus Beckwithbacteria bacterium GW2011_GWC1_49_16]OGD48811.1 MAG: hypothetical protein A2877_04010 [Candidatus Beckwithbacteria bacterium RIFCSPHIGHO2_01_FULL_49_39]OGD49910.1 MAG: hypothetical protein A3D86_04550 [Candidatus Beckwithbacteria bacterium RIFCSPHIGHO2_02_FULL_49_13]OGD50311.1 MAG: hypothetical protein A3K56_01310 [Candidatus Beckwithbacteria bacterium RIFCSPHIGHO2_12_FULL_49_13]OGD60594.1 MAG: hypothetical protein A3B59_01725 [Cand
MLVFSGSSNKLLAQRVAAKLKTRLGKVELSRFANDEARVWVKEARVGKRAILVQSMSAPTDEHLIEFCLLGDALVRRGVKKIIAVIPWLGYTKQDKVFRPGEPLSVAVIAKIIELLPLQKVITFDLHKPHTRRFFKTPIANLSARELLEEYFRKRVSKNTIVVAPDVGSVKSNTSFAKKLKLPLVKIDKKRSLANGKVRVGGVSDEVKGKRVLIKDDMIATGSTLIEAVKFLKAKGASQIEVAATHHLYVPGAQAKLDRSPIARVVVTDTVEPRVKSKKLVVLSVAEVIAREIRV